MQKYLLLLVFIVSMLLSACSSKAPLVGLKAEEDNGVRIYIAADPDPLQAGENKILVKLVDIGSGQPIVNANVTISAYNDLAGGGDRESGRSQGNGEYDVPVDLGIPDTYKLDVEVQRPGEQDSDATFNVTAD